jgi:hypothetical protein
MQPLAAPRRTRTLNLLAAAALLAVVVLVGVRLWASVERGTMPLLRQVQAAADGRVFVPLEDRLYVEGPGGASLDVVPLARFGLQQVQGDFAVLSDGTLLLKPWQQEGPEPLQRCHLETGDCRALAGPGEHFRAGDAFRLEVDEAAGRIHVADTVHHALLLLDLEGRVLARRERGLRYPSAVTPAADGTLWVSDTRHRRLARVRGGVESFGEVLEEVDVRGWSPTDDVEYPKGVAVAADGSRFVVLADGTISHGALYRLGPGGAGRERLELPEGTETMYPEALADAVLLPDDGVYRIHRFAPDGTRLEDFGSPPLKARLATLAARAAWLERAERWSLVGLLLVAVPMLLAALVASRRRAAAARASAGAADTGEAVLRHPETRVRLARGEAHFQRRHLFLDPREVRRVAPWAALLLGGPTVLLLLMVGSTVAVMRPQGEVKGPLGLMLAAFATLLGLTALWVVATGRRERLLLDADGIRYVSPLPGLRSLDWALPWAELAGVELRPLPGTVGWRYELRDTRGRTRRLDALLWRLVGEEEVGLTLADLRRPDRDRVQALVRRTQLHRALAPRLRG